MSSSQTSQTLDRGLQIIEILASAGEDMTATEIATALDIHRTIAHRLISTLERRALVARSPIGRYRLGTRLLSFAATVDGELRAIARPALAALKEQTDETVHLAILTGPNVQFIDAFESSKALRVASRVGRMLPAHATSAGKALLAALPVSEVETLLPSGGLERTAPGTITTRSELMTQLVLIRKQGYATSREESEVGVGSVGVVIVDRRSTARAALSIAAPTVRLAPQLPELIAAAIRTGKLIGNQL